MSSEQSKDWSARTARCWQKLTKCSHFQTFLGTKSLLRASDFCMSQGRPSFAVNHSLHLSSSCFFWFWFCMLVRDGKSKLCPCTNFIWFSKKGSTFKMCQFSIFQQNFSTKNGISTHGPPPWIRWGVIFFLYSTNYIDLTALYIAYFI